MSVKSRVFARRPVRSTHSARHMHAVERPLTTGTSSQTRDPSRVTFLDRRDPEYLWSQRVGLAARPREGDANHGTVWAADAQGGWLSPVRNRVEPQVEVAPYLAPVPHVPTRSMEETRPTMTTALKNSESILAAGLTIEGKIECNGNIRVAGRFQGNVKVTGELTVEPGASIDGEVKADTVLVGGEVKGLIVAASRVEFKESGVLIGDLKAGSLTVAAGSKMRGNVEFGWKEGEIEAGRSDHTR